MTAYVALLRKDADSDYGVDFPDFPGCVTAGLTLEDARRMAAEALQLHIEGMIEDGAPIPLPSPLEDIMVDPLHRDGVAVLIDAAVRRPAVRINVSLPPDLLEAIDRTTENRSRFLAEAAWERLRRVEQSS
ncbi:MAG: type II toxin-antitoxin system HicB family antitoxin [Alphaproteobacteria bacterium]|nr:type II toxin-antitoxin system HicB family antitoxin [Alphaproteobacteria bacterium]